MNLSVRDAAKLLQVSEKSIYRWIKQELIPAYRFQGQHRFNRAELLEWATSRRMGIAPEAFTEPESAAQPLPTLTESLENGGIIYRLHGTTRNEVLENLVSELRLSEDVDRNYLLKVLIAREELSSTGIGDGIALPHPRQPMLTHVHQPMVTLAFLEKPVEFNSLDGQPVNILFSIISPTLRAHLYLLSMLSFACRKSNFLNVLKNEGGREDIFHELKKIKDSIQGR